MYFISYQFRWNSSIPWLNTHPLHSIEPCCSPSTVRVLAHLIWTWYTQLNCTMGIESSCYPQHRQSTQGRLHCNLLVLRLNTQCSRMWCIETGPNRTTRIKYQVKLPRCVGYSTYLRSCSEDWVMLRERPSLWYRTISARKSHRCGGTRVKFRCTHL